MDASAIRKVVTRGGKVFHTTQGIAAAEQGFVIRINSQEIVIIPQGSVDYVVLRDEAPKGNVIEEPYERTSETTVIHGVA